MLIKMVLEGGRRGEKCDKHENGKVDNTGHYTEWVSLMSTITVSFKKKKFESECQ